MVASETPAGTATSPSPLSRSSWSAPPSSLPPPSSRSLATPCAACKMLRRRCNDNCVLAHYFPPSEPLKFATAHQVFGASNIIKLIQDLPQDQKADAVTSMVYEADVRIRNPVYGCAGTICQLQELVRELQTQLAKAQVELVNMQTQQSSLQCLLASICKEYLEHSPSSEQLVAQPLPENLETNPLISSSNLPNCSLPDEYIDDLGLAWESFWDWSEI